MIRIPGSTRTRAAVAAAAVLAAGAAVTTSLGGDPDADAGRNVAFVDTAATDQVMQDIGRAAEAAFTISPDKVGATRRSAHKVLTGDAVEQYDELYGPYLEKAGADGLTLVTTVRAIGVTWLESDQATLLVLADQAGRAASGQSGVGPAQLKLEARRTDGSWKISAIELL
jgi:Mce-associated membrane protein